MRERTIDIVDDAVRLLRQAPLETWLCQWVGSVPFALAALRFWTDVTNPRLADSTCAIESLALALLLVWMNSWRAVFAGRLRTQLSGTAGIPWSARRIWNLLAGQAFFSGTKLLMFPLALLTIFPFSGMVAFYRTVSVVSGYEGLPPLEAMAKARRLAGTEPRQAWALLPILLFLYTVAVINLGIVLALLPQLTRMFSGSENTFSRSGKYYILNPLFLLLLASVSWIAFDPLVQAVYSVRSFRGESLRTGEDLRVGIRRFATVALLLIVIRPAVAVTPAELENAVHQAMESPEYAWRLPPPAGSAAKPSWLIRVTDRMLKGIQSVYQRLADAWDRLFDWLFRRGTAMPRPGAPPGAGLHWSLYVLIGLVMAAGLWIAWRGGRPRRPKPAAVSAGVPAVQLDDADLTADRLPEEKWYELAEQSLSEGNPRLALRAFYLANLAWLGRREFLAIHAGKTNREYEVELRRKTRAFPDARGLFAANVAAFERAWYGMHEVVGEDVSQFRRRIDGMKSVLEAA